MFAFQGLANQRIFQETFKLMGTVSWATIGDMGRRVVSSSECAVRCGSVMGCVSFAYGTADRVCVLSTSHIQTEDGLGDALQIWTI